MKNFVLAVFTGSLLAAGCSGAAESKGRSRKMGNNAGVQVPVLPSAIKGNFSDDYGSSYLISDSQLLQQPGNNYRLVLCDTASKFIIARNDSSNSTEPGLYTRIDYMFFSGMEPWAWGYCLTVYNAVSDAAAIAAKPADRNNPRKGCNGFPFTRMKRTTL